MYLRGSPGNLETPPPGPAPRVPLTRTASSSALSSQPSASPLPMTSGDKNNQTLTEDAKRSLAADLEKAREKLKDDKSAAKKAVQSLKEGLSKPGKTVEKQEGRGKGGKGRGRGRGRGGDTNKSNGSKPGPEAKKNIHAAVKEVYQEAEELDGEEVEQDMEDMEEEEKVEDPVEDEDSMDAPTEEMGEDFYSRARGTMKKPSAAKKPTKKEAAKIQKMKAAKKKRDEQHKKRVAAIKKKGEAEIKKIKGKGKDKSDKAEDSSKAWGCNLREEMFKYIRAESARLVEGGMSKKDALAAARESCLGQLSVSSLPISHLLLSLMLFTPQDFQSTYWFPRTCFRPLRYPTAPPTHAS